MVTIREKIESFEDEYNKGDIIHKFLMHTCLLMEKFEIEEKLKWLNTQPEVTREEYLKALDHKSQA